MSRPALAFAVLATMALGSPLALAADVRVATSIRPRAASFGDVIHATLTVRSDTPVTVQEGFAPFQVVRASTTSTHAQNGVVTTWRFDLQCLDARCAPGPGARRVSLAPARVHAGPHVVLARFRAVRVDPRATEAQVANPARSFMHPTTPPPPSFRFSPRTAQKALIAAAAALVLVALALVAPLVRSRRAQAPVDHVDALAQALALVEAARSRSPADRRRALGLLARVLRKRGASSIGQAAADLAWSEPEPDPARMAQLVDRIGTTP